MLLAIIFTAVYIKKDINSIFHLHTANTVAVSAQKKGLKPLSQWAFLFYDKISYYDYNSLALNENESLEIAKHLGDINMNMMLRNHGIITTGKSVHEAMYYAYHLEMACKVQAILSCVTQEELIFPNKEILKRTNADLIAFEEDLGKRDWDAWVRILNKKGLL